MNWDEQMSLVLFCNGFVTPGKHANSPNLVRCLGFMIVFALRPVLLHSCKYGLLCLITYSTNPDHRCLHFTPVDSRQPWAEKTCCQFYLVSPEFFYHEVAGTTFHHTTIACVLACNAQHLTHWIMEL